MNSFVCDSRLEMSAEPTANGAPPVPLRTGPPTKEELAYYYPAKFTWKQLKTFINAGYAHSLIVLFSL